MHFPRAHAVNKIYGDTASLSGIQLYGQDSQETAVDYICQVWQIYSGKTKKNRHPEEVFTADQDGQGPCGYSTSQVALETAGAASSTPRQQVPTAGGTPGAAGQTPNTVPTAGGMPGDTGQIYPPNMINPLTGQPDPNIIDPATGQPYPNIIDPATGLPYPKIIDPTTGLPYNPSRSYTNMPHHSMLPNYFGSQFSASSRLQSPLFSSSLWGASTFYVCLLISLFVPQIPNTLMLHHNDQIVEIDSKYLSCDPITNHMPAEDDEEEDEEEKEEDDDDEEKEDDDEKEEGGYYCKFRVRLEQKDDNKCVSRTLDFGEIGGGRDKGKSGPIDERKDNAKKRITDQKDSSKNGTTDKKDSAKQRITDQKV
ncbi:hypothetical protein niasHT_018497 [Heterodera trifolii]|uniref:Uncharacterized protein n=1 Tax=Heterodera trifolii TaxID=157864 RepID=A0ABD2KTX9_9BILA